ncbi:MAG TPA: hypothetical protein VGK48_17575 [Terriglobia bacterium]|jgi:hypothetical protein
MINRFCTRCTTCGHNNTLRITLGAEQRQEHTFSCSGCGIGTKVALEIDFNERIPLALPDGANLSEQIKPMFSQPKVIFQASDNCAVCDHEGTVTNLDPNFLVPENLLHADGGFSWMQEIERIGMIEEQENLKPKPHIHDIIQGVGGVRELKRAITALAKSWTLQRVGKSELRDKVIEEFRLWANIPVQMTLNQFAIICASLFLGRARQDEIDNMVSEVCKCKNADPSEYQKLQIRLRTNFNEVLDRQIGVLEEYAKAYDQLSQTFIYAIRNTPIDGNVVASSKDVRAVRMFYGNCFEDLATGFDLPACLNNIKMGRAFDQFAQMTLAKYLTINKAGRANPFADNANFAILHEEFDSTIRNASHHGALRVRNGHPEILEYRSGDAGNWREMLFSEYLLRCNKIMMCAMRLLILQIVIAEDLA